MLSNNEWHTRLNPHFITHCFKSQVSNWIFSEIDVSLQTEELFLKMSQFLVNYPLRSFIQVKWMGVKLGQTK